MLQDPKPANRTLAVRRVHIEMVNERVRQLLSSGRHTVPEMAQSIGAHRSSVSKLLIRLEALDQAHRERVSYKRGGAVDYWAAGPGPKFEASDPLADFYDPHKIPAMFEPMARLYGREVAA